ncbi:MAG: hypothetical protein AB7J32_25235 [Pseudonocardia sp.]
MIATGPVAVPDRPTIPPTAPVLPSGAGAFLPGGHRRGTAGTAVAVRAPAGLRHSPEGGR